MGIWNQVRARLPKRLIPWGHSYGSMGVMRLPAITGAEDLEVPRASTALQHPAVMASVNIISRGIAVAPIKVRGIDGAEPAPEAKRIEDWLNRTWSHNFTAYTSKEKLVRDVLLHGVGAAVVSRAGGRPVAIHTIDPGTLTKERRPDGSIKYRISAVDPVVEFESAEVVELSYQLQSDGISWVSPVQAGWNAISAGLLALAFQRDLFARGASPWLILKGDERAIGEAGWQKTQETFNRRLEEVQRGGRRAVLLPDRVDVSEVGMDPVAAQLEQLGQQSVEQIARLYGVPLSFLADPRAGGYASLEEESRRLVRQTLGPYAEQLEQQLDKVLFPAGRHRVKLDLDSDIRGDAATRWTNYTAAIRSGVMTPNEVRALEGMAPSDDPAADQLMKQGAMVPLSSDESEPPQFAPEEQINPFEEEDPDDEE